jgi:hypothetical protein
MLNPLLIREELAMEDSLWPAFALLILDSVLANS